MIASAFSDMVNTASCNASTVSTSEWPSAENDIAVAADVVEDTLALDDAAGSPGGSLPGGGVKSDGDIADTAYHGTKSIQMSRSSA
jgi:hypothetical protein